MDAPPLRDAIVMNIGDLMQRWTNDTLKSTLHRVGLPPPADLDSSHYDNNNNSHDNNNNNSSSSSNGDNNNNNNKNTTNDDKGSDDVNGMTRERYSIPYFVSPEGPTVVECLDTCVSEARPRRHEPIVWNDYMRMRAAMQYE